ncbi:ATP-binding cassette domain-containing protein [Halobacteriovorax sp. GB3]|uniref:cell division ATP-binding protein FtsE n=1 Tax=Halobacteriovorax sp. GB3 TaxID=2719615 RepID=UPI002362D8A0|nr:ATP-binding cassette domain-containing protein [Halobacteriovorax sp. GB3]MDD0853882.1 ATP-binding cassette domain-containing protein [Halobacteriovorax sp. GB3]
MMNTTFQGQFAKQGMSNSRFDNLFFLENLSVRFDKVRALQNIHLSIERGEIVFITGPSGAGKTTLLRLLSGEIKPDVGTIRLPEKNVFISRVFQDLRLIERLSVEENLKLVFDPAIYHSKGEFIQDMNELCRILGIQNRLHLKVKDANGGLKQKVAIIRALLSRPQVFIADEPTSSLDGDNARKLFEVLNLYNVKKGLTVIWASHNRELVKKFTGRIIHLDSGKLVYSGHACFI